MTVKYVPICLCPNHSRHHPQLVGIISDWVHKGRVLSPSNLRRLHLPRFQKLECFGVLLDQRAVKLLGDDIPELRGFHKDLTSLPS